MIVLGLTGSIGMGKSSAAKMFRRMGIPVFDSDVAVHAALSDKDVIREIGAAFSGAVSKGSIDRKALGEIIFNDKKARKKLEAILHPHVWRGQKVFSASMKRMGHSIVVLDIPLLFETGAEKRVDYVVCVTAPHDIQKRRVLARPGMDEERFYKILEQQMPDAQKQARSDFVVQTGLGYALTFRQLKDIVRDLRQT